MYTVTLVNANWSQPIVITFTPGGAANNCTAGWGNDIPTKYTAAALIPAIEAGLDVVLGVSTIT